MITRKEFNEMSFEDAWEYCCGESDYFKDRDSLSECANQCIKNGNDANLLNILIALHNCPYTNYWFYLADECSCPVPIDCKADLQFYLNNLAILEEVR